MASERTMLLSASQLIALRGLRGTLFHRAFENFCCPDRLSPMRRVSAYKRLSHFGRPGRTPARRRLGRRCARRSFRPGGTGTAISSSAPRTAPTPSAFSSITWTAPAASIVLSCRSFVSEPGIPTPETGVHPTIPGGTTGLGLNDYHYQYKLWVIDLCYEIGLTKVYAEPKNEFGYDVGPLCSLEAQIEWFKFRCQALRNLKYTLVIGSARPPVGPARCRRSRSTYLTCPGTWA